MWCLHQQVGRFPLEPWTCAFRSVVFLTARKLSGAHCETSSAMLHKRQGLLEQDLVRLSCAAALLLSIITSTRDIILSIPLLRFNWKEAVGRKT